MIPTDEEQVAALIALDPSRQLQLGRRPGDVPFLRLVDGREIVHADSNGGYDVWSTEGADPLLFDLTLEQARRVAGLA